MLPDPGVGVPFAGRPGVVCPEGRRVDPGAVPERPGATVLAGGLVAAGEPGAPETGGAFRARATGSTPAAGSPAFTGRLLMPCPPRRLGLRRPGALIAGRERRLSPGVAEPALCAREATGSAAGLCESCELAFPTWGSGTPGSRPSPRAPASNATNHRTVSAATAPPPSRSARARRPSPEANTWAPAGSASRPRACGWATGNACVVCGAAESITTAITRRSTKGSLVGTTRPRQEETLQPSSATEATS